MIIYSHLKACHCCPRYSPDSKLSHAHMASLYPTDGERQAATFPGLTRQQFICNRTLCWKTSWDNHHDLPVSDVSRCILVTCHHQQLWSLWYQHCTVVAMLFPRALYSFTLSLLNCKSMTPNCPLYLKKSSLFTFFSDCPLIFQFLCLLKSSFPFQKLCHICKIWMSLL